MRRNVVPDMRSLFCLFVFGCPSPGQSQTPIDSAKAPFIIHLETGMHLAWYSQLPAADVVSLGQWPDLAQFTTRGSEGNVMDGQAPFFTLGFQKSLNKIQKLSVYAGISWFDHYFATTSLYRDSMTFSSPRSVQPTGDTLFEQHYVSYQHLLSLNGTHLHLPVGIRLRANNGWLQLGVNIVPGILFNNLAGRELVIRNYTVTADRHGEVYARENEEPQFSDVKPRVEKKRVPGTWFSMYASLPAHVTINPNQPWQFIFGFEPGISFTQLGDASGRTSFISRISLGLRYQAGTN